MTERLPETVLDALAKACAAHPTQRVAQVFVNATTNDPFYIEDRDLTQRLLVYAQKGTNQGV